MSDRSPKVLAREDFARSGLFGLSDKLSELEAAVTQQADRFNAVLDIGTSISSARDVDDLLRLVMDKLTSLLRAEASTLFMLDEKKQELWSRVLKGSSLKEIRVPAGSGIAGHVVKTGQLLHIADCYDDSRFNPEIDRQSGFKTRSMIAVPLRHVSGRILGVVEVLHRKVNAFTSEDLSLVGAVASQLAAVVDNVLLMEELRRQNEELAGAKEELSSAVRELDLLYEIEQAAASDEPQPVLFERILKRVTRALHSTVGCIFLVSHGKGTLFVRRARGGKDGSAFAEIPFKEGQGIVGAVTQTATPVRVDHADASPFFERALARKVGAPIGSVLCVPIPGENESLGALELSGRKEGFSAADERLASMLAGQIGRAVLRRRQREEGEYKARLAAVGQMLSGVLHDLRTPMSLISAYAELMVKERDESARGRLAAVIGQQFEHINGMTRETIAFARGERDLLLRKVYLQSFIAEVEEYLRRDFAGSGIELKVLAHYTGTARIDENKLKRVIYNIARNARQAMPEGGRFTFTVERDGQELLLRFADNGPGIPPEIVGRVFDSFVTFGRSEGSGLGLAIVKQIAEEHGGSVSCKSRLGKGTTFEVRVPMGG